MSFKNTQEFEQYVESLEDECPVITVDQNTHLGMMAQVKKLEQIGSMYAQMGVTITEPEFGLNGIIYHYTITKEGPQYHTESGKKYHIEVQKD